jgi:hypothetical protein
VISVIHPRLSEIEVGFRVSLVARKFLADSVRLIAEGGGAFGSGYFLAEWMEVTAGDDLAELVRQYPRAAEMIGCQIARLGGPGRFGDG